MDLIERTKKQFWDNLERLENGGVNCIPSPFEDFMDDFPGVEQGKYYLISGAAKSSKTQISSLLFLYTPILYAYYHPDQIRLKIFYFALEETEVKITARFMSHLLFRFSSYQIRMSPMVLNSINENNKVSREVLQLLDTPKYNDILQFYKNHVEFPKDKNPTGCMKQVIKYAKEHGTMHMKWDARLEKDVFDYYEPNDPDEYVIILWDHAGLTQMEKSEGRMMSLKESIDKLSSYFVDFRDNLHYTPVLIQQQNLETLSLEAYKAKKIMPTLAGLADTKNTGKDCSMFLGITNPHAFEIEEYRGFDTERLGGWCRFFEVVMHREGESNGYLPLYFDGAVNYFKPLPQPEEVTELAKVYNHIDSMIDKNP